MGQMFQRLRKKRGIGDEKVGEITTVEETRTLACVSGCSATYTAVDLATAQSSTPEPCHVETSLGNGSNTANRDLAVVGKELKYKRCSGIALIGSLCGSNPVS